jgi:hypothetical protein
MIFGTVRLTHPMRLLPLRNERYPPPGSINPDS